MPQSARFTACPKAKKQFLAVGGALKKVVVLIFFFVDHPYPLSTEFAWTKLISWKKFNKTFILNEIFTFFQFLTPDFDKKCHFCNLSWHTRIFVQMNSTNMVNQPPKYQISYLWFFSTVPPTTVKTFTFLCHGFSHDNIHGFTHAISFPFLCHGISHANQTLWMPWKALRDAIV